MRGIGPARRSSAGLLASICAVGLVLVASLTALGTWQIQRRAWKHDLIARVDARVHADPVEAPGPGNWTSLTAEADAYRRIRAKGRLRHDRETLVQAVTELGGGFWVMTPLERADGTTILINRGFVPADRRDPTTRGEGAARSRSRSRASCASPSPAAAFCAGTTPLPGAGTRATSMRSHRRADCPGRRPTSSMPMPLPIRAAGRWAA